MPSLGSTVALLFIAAGLTGVWGQAASQQTPHDGASLPIAAFAWAQTNCDSTLSMHPGTPRIQAEDLMRVAATYDADRAARGVTLACQRALANAQSVVATFDSGAATNFSVFAWRQ
jgi:hypothetical protein